MLTLGHYLSPKKNRKLLDFGTFCVLRIPCYNIRHLFTAQSYHYSDSTNGTAWHDASNRGSSKNNYQIPDTYYTYHLIRHVANIPLANFPSTMTPCHHRNWWLRYFQPNSKIHARRRLETCRSRAVVGDVEAEELFSPTVRRGYLSSR